MNVDAHPTGIILQSLTKVDGARFSMSRNHWRSNLTVWRRLPETVFGGFKRWVSKNDNKVTVDWESDGLSSTEYLKAHSALTPNTSPQPSPSPFALTLPLTHLPTPVLAVLLSYLAGRG